MAEEDTQADTRFKKTDICGLRGLCGPMPDGAGSRPVQRAGECCHEVRI